MTWFCFALLLLLPQSLLAGEDHSDILILHSYHKALRSDVVLQGIESVFPEGSADFFVEYMDTKRQQSEAYLQSLYESYKLKYSRVRFDVILVSDDNAFRFALKHHHDLFHSAPIVFSGVNDFDPAVLAGHPNVTGLTEKGDFKETLEAALRMRPEARKLYVICDDTETALTNRRNLQEVLAKHFPQLQPHYLQDLTKAQLAEALRRAEPEALVFFIAFWHDAAGTPLSPEDLAPLFNNSSAPIFGRNAWMLGKGLVGGKCVSGFHQGQAAARLAQQILAGADPASIPITADANIFMFDYPTLLKYGLDPSQVPPESILLNRPDLFYKVPKRTALLVALGTVLLLLLVTALAMNIVLRRRGERALRESERRFRSTFEQAAVGIVNAALDGHFLRVNQRFCDITGYSRPELLARTFQQITHPDDLQADLEQVTALLAGRIATFAMEKRYIRKDDSLVWVNLTVSLLRDEANQPQYFVAIIEDITERKQAETALREARQVAEHASKAKDQFLAVLSHELRTPLTPVLLTASALQSEPSLSATVREDLASIRRNVELEARLIDDLLDMTRIVSGKLALRQEVLDLHALLQTALRTCHADVQAKNLAIHTDLAASDIHVQGDATRLQQVFWNLLKNAIKFTPESGAITIRTWNEEGGREGDGARGRKADKETRGLGDQGTSSAALSIENGKSRIENPQDSALSTQHSALLIEITDTGLGMSPDVLGRLFRMFEQGDRHITRTFGGLGMGLAIAKAIVDLHAGSISARSDGPGRGATFTVRLPIVSPPAHHLPPPRQSSSSAARSLRILLVEDHDYTAQMLARLLRGRHHRVEVAGNLAAARQLAENHAFDLVVSDLGLPDGSGWELMPELKRRFGLPGIAVSGYGMDQDIRRSLQAGFAVHLTKPIDIDHLHAAIKLVVDTPHA